jgi:L-alanine-DL-glutamate epimerase-like enolase superfamily enzyme
MKITGVRTQPFEVTMDRSIGDARQQFGGSALRLDTDEGVTGIALGAGPQVHSMVEELLVGRDPRGVKWLWKVMDDRVFKGGNRGAVTGAIASLDVALWGWSSKPYLVPRHFRQCGVAS